MDLFRPFFPLFSSFQNSFKCSWYTVNRNGHWLDSNLGSRMLEVTSLPTAPQPLPCFYKSVHIKYLIVFHYGIDAVNLKLSRIVPTQRNYMFEAKK